jgi:hypothetical protein
MNTQILSNIAIGTHEDCITKCAEIALKPYRLVVLDSEDPNKITYANTDGLPIGVSDDAAEIDEIVTVNLLGCSNTIPITAGSNIEAGELLIPGSEGKILPMPTDAGEYNCVGIALSTAANGEEVEVLTSLPYPYTITE